MDSVSELDVLLSQAIVVAENKNEMKNISQLPLFIQRVTTNLFPRRFSGFEKKIRNTGFVFFLF